MGEPVLFDRLKQHLGCDPATLQVVEQDFGLYQRPNLQLAIDEILGSAQRTVEVIGVIVPEDHYSVSLSKLSGKSAASGFEEGPIELVDVELADGQRLSCVKRGLYFIHDDEQPLVMLLVSQPDFYPGSGIVVEVMAKDRTGAERFLRELTKVVRYGKAFRGRVLSLESDCIGSLTVKYHRLPQIGRKDVILPEEIMQRIERHTISFSRHAEKLRAAGRHLKRGVLLYGPPGTGKTLAAMYLVSQMQQRTVLILTGPGMNSIETACTLARVLEPSTLILEDVDLIGTQREHQTVDANALLFELLNQMDGLSDDADILFILTTNRPDVLEPALASRPGRIDQAIEIPLPDADCRLRLFNLYRKGLEITLSDWERLIERTEGVSAAFIRELLRKAAVLAAEESNEDRLLVQDRHVDGALKEMLVAGGSLTQSLLGARIPSDQS